jgi:thiazolylpeptide-type bacteriocin precursor
VTAVATNVLLRDLDLDLDLGDLKLEELEVTNVREAMALPETGASSGFSSCNSCSCCGSSSCCSS